jgi:hypothetical protein
MEGKGNKKEAKRKQESIMKEATQVKKTKFRMHKIAEKMIIDYANYKVYRCLKNCNAISPP